MWKEIKLYFQWVRVWKRLPVKPWVEAAVAYKAGEFALAEQKYEQGLNKHSRHIASRCALLDLAYCKQKLGKFQEAEHLLRKILSRDLRCKEAYVRLSDLLRHTGRSFEAACLLKRANRSFPLDEELCALFVFAVLDNGGPEYLIREARMLLKQHTSQGSSSNKVKLAKARLAVLAGNSEHARELVDEVLCRTPNDLEALITSAQIALENHKVAIARQALRRALKASPKNPRVLACLAQSYLVSGPFYNANYAAQLAVLACQSSGWLGAKEMHTLAEAYYHQGDKMSALLMASKAKTTGQRLLGAYSDVKGLDRLIESLSGTQA